MSDPYLGMILDGIQLEQKLGQGGMGSVYFGRNLTLDKPVAVKILLPECSGNPNSVERFLREARSAAKLEHPHIVQIYNAGSSQSLYYMVMQYIQGQSLQKHLDYATQIPFPQALSVIKATLQGLAFAHRHHIIHRDIKPDNIMLSSLGEIKIVDFGLARSLEQDGKLSITGQILGTPYYMSPEQCSGELLDLRTDIYSLGVTFYYLLSGKRPYDGENPLSILMQHRSPEPLPPLPEKIQKQIPPPFLPILRKMTEKDREKRYSSLDETFHDLTSIFQTVPSRPLISIRPTIPPPLPPANASSSSITLASSKSQLLQTLSTQQQMELAEIPTLLTPSSPPPPSEPQSVASLATTKGWSSLGIEPPAHPVRPEAPQGGHLFSSDSSPSLSPLPLSEALPSSLIAPSFVLDSQLPFRGRKSRSFLKIFFFLSLCILGALGFYFREEGMDLWNSWKASFSFPWTETIALAPDPVSSPEGFSKEQLLLQNLHFLAEEQQKRALSSSFKEEVQKRLQEITLRLKTPESFSSVLGQELDLLNLYQGLLPLKNEFQEEYLVFQTQIPLLLKASFKEAQKRQESFELFCEMISSASTLEDPVFQEFLKKWWTEFFIPFILGIFKEEMEKEPFASKKLQELFDALLPSQEETPKPYLQLLQSLEVPLKKIFKEKKNPISLEKFKILEESAFPQLFPQLWKSLEPPPFSATESRLSVSELELILTQQEKGLSVLKELFENYHPAFLKRSVKQRQIQRKIQKLFRFYHFSQKYLEDSSSLKGASLEKKNRLEKEYEALKTVLQTRWPQLYQHIFNPSSSQD
jgi:serine/threonine protein kinase